MAEAGSYIAAMVGMALGGAIGAVPGAVGAGLAGGSTLRQVAIGVGVGAGVGALVGLGAVALAPAAAAGDSVQLGCAACGTALGAVRRQRMISPGIMPARYTWSQPPDPVRRFAGGRPPPDDQRGRMVF